MPPRAARPASSSPGIPTAPGRRAPRSGPSRRGEPAVAAGEQDRSLRSGAQQGPRRGDLELNRSRTRPAGNGASHQHEGSAAPRRGRWSGRPGEISPPRHARESNRAHRCPLALRHAAGPPYRGGRDPTCGRSAAVEAEIARVGRASRRGSCPPPARPVGPGRSPDDDPGHPAEGGIETGAGRPRCQTRERICIENLSGSKGPDERARRVRISSRPTRGNGTRSPGDRVDVTAAIAGRLLGVPPRLLQKYALRTPVSGPGRGPIRTGRTGSRCPTRSG